MHMTTFPPNLFDGFSVRDRDDVCQKLSAFAGDGPAKLHCVFDFDHTITAGKVEGENVGTWDVLDELIPEEGRRLHNVIYLSHRDRELAGELTEAEAEQWWTETLDLICSYSINIYQAEQSFLDVAKLRSGGSQLFDACQRAGVPTVVLSAGVSPTIILATEFDVSPDGQVAGWKKETLVHMLNKREMGHKEMSLLRETRPNVLLLGDVPDDVHMAEGDNALRVRVIDPRKGEIYNEKEIVQKSFDAGFDLAVKTDLMPLARMLSWLVGS
jgi:phosphoserine phosphatase